MFLVPAYGQFLKANGESPVTWKRAASMDEVLQQADVVCLSLNHIPLFFTFLLSFDDVVYFWSLVLILDKPSPDSR